MNSFTLDPQQHQHTPLLKCHTSTPTAIPSPLCLPVTPAYNAPYIIPTSKWPIDYFNTPRNVCLCPNFLHDNGRHPNFLSKSPVIQCHPPFRLMIMMGRSPQLNCSFRPNERGAAHNNNTRQATTNNQPVVSAAAPPPLASAIRMRLNGMAGTTTMVVKQQKWRQQPRVEVLTSEQQRGHRRREEHWEDSTMS